MKPIYETKIYPIKEYPDISPEMLDLIIKDLNLRYTLDQGSNITLLKTLCNLLRGECHLVALGNTADGRIKHIALCYRNYLYDYRGRISDELIVSFGTPDTCEIKDVHPGILDTPVFDEIYSPSNIIKKDINLLSESDLIKMAINLELGVPIQ